MGHTVIVLVTPEPHTLKVEDNQRKVITWLNQKKISYQEVDAISQMDIRKELTTISKVNGNYPQVFITDGDSETTYVGGFDEIESMIELNSIDQATLKANPQIKTFDIVFKDCKK